MKILSLTIIFLIFSFAGDASTDILCCNDSYPVKYTSPYDGTTKIWCQSSSSGKPHKEGNYKIISKDGTVLETKVFKDDVAVPSLRETLNCNNEVSKKPDQNTSKSNMQVTSNNLNSCVLKDKVAQCWGFDAKRIVIPPLKNPKSIFAGHRFACAIDDDGVKCWVWDDKPSKLTLTKIPPLKNPTMVGTGADYACAIHAEGVRCWGMDDDLEKRMPKLSGPKYVTVGLTSACAIDDFGTHCWGMRKSYDLPKLHNSKTLDFGNNFGCALDDFGVKCWGGNDEGQTNVPKLNNPKSISVGGFHACALDDIGVHCWGSNKYKQLEVPKLTNPTSISAGSLHQCALMIRA
jgi:hypothetical protein